MENKTTWFGGKTRKYFSNNNLDKLCPSYLQLKGNEKKIVFLKSQAIKNNSYLIYSKNIYTLFNILE